MKEYMISSADGETVLVNDVVISPSRLRFLMKTFNSHCEANCTNRMNTKCVALTFEHPDKETIKIDCEVMHGILDVISTGETKIIFQE